MNASEWIERLQLIRHPEGGYYRETYHATTMMTDATTLETYGSSRRSATSIYFLLERSDVSHFHRLKSDELWFFHVGDPLTVHVIDPAGTYQEHRLGLDISNGQLPQQLVPKNHIFGATVEPATVEPATVEPATVEPATVEPATGESQASKAGFSLVSCMVTPGFDFADFELFERNKLLTSYPKHQKIIQRLTEPDNF